MFSEKVKNIVILILTLIVLVCMCLLSTNRSEKVGEVEIHTIDTIFVSDTITMYQTKYVETKVKDTIYLPLDNEDVNRGELALEVVSKHYSKKDTFDIWLSGVEPLSLDSVKIYPKTQKIIHYETKERLVYKDEANIFVGGGLLALQDTYLPYVGISLATKKKTLYTLNFSKTKQDYYIGLDVKFKLF
jgi:hypothetical protein